MPADRDTSWSATVRTGPVLAIVLASYTMIVLDIRIVITALPQIHHDLGFSTTALSWVQNAYLPTAPTSQVSRCR